jgi:hypothetical protein
LTLVADQRLLVRKVRGDGEREKSRASLIKNCVKLRESFRGEKKACGRAFYKLQTRYKLLENIMRLLVLFSDCQVLSYEVLLAFGF